MGFRANTQTYRLHGVQFLHPWVDSLYIVQHIFASTGLKEAEYKQESKVTESRKLIVKCIEANMKESFHEWYLWTSAFQVEQNDRIGSLLYRFNHSRKQRNTSFLFKFISDIQFRLKYYCYTRQYDIYTKQNNCQNH